MKALQIQKNSDGYFLNLSDSHDIPSYGDDEVLIKVHAAGVNRADLYQLAGHYPLPEENNNIPGLELSGEIIELGNDVKGLKKGDKVCALTMGGAYAEYASVPYRQILPIPQGMNMKQAAALPEAFAATWLTIKMQAAMQKGETILVHGGSSGIGMAAIWLVKNIIGGDIIVTAGSTEKCKSCEQLGAIAINYHENDFVESVKDITNGKGVNVVLDMIGGGYIERNFKCMAQYGRMVSIALIKGANIDAKISGFFLKNLKWQGTTLRSQKQDKKAEIIEDLKINVWPALYHQSQFPVIDSVFTLDNVKKAHKKMHNSLHIGKIILDVG